MNYGDTVSIIKEEIKKVEEYISRTRWCPVCKNEVLMLRVNISGANGEVVKWRCLGCLGLFNEWLEKED